MRKKQLLFLLILVLLCLSLNFVALAHPGKTDSDGGHTESDSGEYHYHHGQESHSHYDMDGDGDIDCPYDFVDVTGQNSGAPGNSSNQTADSSINTDNVSSDGSPPSAFQQVLGFVFSAVIIILKIVGYLFIALFALAFFRLAFDKPIRYLSCRYRKLSKQQMLFIHARRYARLPIDSITKEFNDVFYTEYRDHELKNAYYKSIENSIYINAPVDSIMIDFIDFFLISNASWLDIAVLVNQQFRSCYGPNELKVKYSEQSSKSTPTRNTTQYLLVEDEDGFLMHIPTTPPEIQHTDRTPEEIAVHRQRVHDAIVNGLYGDDSNTK